MKDLYTNAYEGVMNTDTQGTRKTRLCFTHAWDILLLKAITLTEASTAVYGEAERRFSEVLAHFIAAVPL